MGSSLQDLAGVLLILTSYKSYLVVIVIFKVNSIESKGFPVISCTACDDERKREGVGKGRGMLGGVGGGILDLDMWTSVIAIGSFDHKTFRWYS